MVRKKNDPVKLRTKIHEAIDNNNLLTALFLFIYFIVLYFLFIQKKKKKLLSRVPVSRGRTAL